MVTTFTSDLYWKWFLCTTWSIYQWYSYIYGFKAENNLSLSNMDTANFVLSKNQKFVFSLKAMFKLLTDHMCKKCYPFTQKLSLNLCFTTRNFKISSRMTYDPFCKPLISIHINSKFNFYFFHVQSSESPYVFRTQPK